MVGITVDHRLREGSRDEAERVGETVRKLGAEHLTLTLDWAERPTPGKTQVWRSIQGLGGGGGGGGVVCVCV